MSMVIAITGGTSYGVVIRDGNRVVSMDSPDPWYRLMRATADLFIAGEIDIHDLQAVEHLCMFDGEQLRVFGDIAAREIAGALALTWMEPNCLCDIYREKPCGCPEADRRTRLRELIGA